MDEIIATQPYHAAAIIVTYEPNDNDLTSLIKALAPQVEAIYIIDNGSTNQAILNLTSKKFFIIKLESNMGIAYAQNVGLVQAQQDGYPDYILFDQDSLPAPDMVHALFTAREKAIKNGVKVAAVGPVHIDKDSLNENVYIRSGKVSIQKVKANPNQDFIVCDFIIASGALINEEALCNIGKMENKLFIDCVDIEWGFRAMSHGYCSIFTHHAKMFHKIGESPLVILGKQITTHTPIRHYYFYRNLYILLKRRYVPTSWKLHCIVKSTIQAVIFCILLPNKKAHFAAISQGIIDAFQNQLGKKK